MSQEHRKEDRTRGLGRGLSALIGDESAPALNRGALRAKDKRILPVAFLTPNRFQPRKRFSDDDLQDLTNSVKEKGVLQPILVRPVAGKQDAYEIIAGERRWRAAQAAHLHEVPVVVREMSDRDALEIAIIENVQRADLNAIEEAAAYQELMERFSYTQEEVAKQVGKSRSHIANTLRLLKLPETVLEMVRAGDLSAGHARTLINDPDAEAHAKAIVEGGLNVRDSEKAAQKKATKKGAKVPAFVDPNIALLQNTLSEALGLKVEVSFKGEDRGGEVRITYKTLEQLDIVTERLQKRR